MKILSICLKLIFVLLVIVLTPTSCIIISSNSNNESLDDTANIVSEMNCVTNPSTNDLALFGTWKLDKIVLKSSVYDRTSKKAFALDLDDYTKTDKVVLRKIDDGKSLQYYIDEDDYLGYEIEYSPEFFRLGEEKYLEPGYRLKDITTEDYEEGGRFRLTWS